MNRVTNETHKSIMNRHTTPSNQPAFLKRKTKGLPPPRETSPKTKLGGLCQVRPPHLGQKEKGMGQEKVTIASKPLKNHI